MVVIFRCTGANHAFDPVLNCNQGSVSAALRLTANCNNFPFNGAILIEKLPPVFSRPDCLQMLKQLDEPVFDAIRTLDENVPGVTALDNCHAKLFKGIWVVVFRANRRRYFIRILEDNYMITQVCSNVAKCKRSFPTARTAFFVSSRNKEIKLMPVLRQVCFVSDNNLAIYINPVRIIKSFYTGVRHRWKN